MKEEATNLKESREGYTARFGEGKGRGEML